MPFEIATNPVVGPNLTFGGNIGGPELPVRLLGKMMSRSGFSKHNLRTTREIVRLVGLLLGVTGVVEFTGLVSQFTRLTFSGIVGMALGSASRPPSRTRIPEF